MREKLSTRHRRLARLNELIPTPAPCSSLELLPLRHLSLIRHLPSQVPNSRKPISINTKKSHKRRRPRSRRALPPFNRLPLKYLSRCALYIVSHSSLSSFLAEKSAWSRRIFFTLISLCPACPYRIAFFPFCFAIAFPSRIARRRCHPCCYSAPLNPISSSDTK